MKDETEKTWVKKKNQANSGESSKPELISQTHNPWNPRLMFNQETQFSINLY